MKRVRHPQPPCTPPEGIVEMVCTEFIDEPEQMRAYADFAARVDAFLAHQGSPLWGTLDVERFMATARDREERATLCCMLATVLPWLVRAGDVSQLQATRMSFSILEACPRDPDAQACISEAMELLGDAAAVPSSGLSH